MAVKRNTNISAPTLTKPIISGSVDVWGNILNENIDKTTQFNSQLIADSENQNQELARLEREKISKTEFVEIVEPVIEELVDTVAKPEINNYIDTVSKPAITQHTENKKQEINNYVDTVSKPNLDSYEKEKESELDVHTQKNKDILDTYTISKQSQLDSYEKTKEVQIDEYTNTKYPQLDEYTNIKEKELDGHTGTKKKQLDDYTSQKEEVLSSHVEDIKGVIDSYEKIKENELDNFTEIKKNEITSHTDSKKIELDEYAKEVHNAIIGYSDEQLIKFKQQATEESDNQIVKVVEEADKQILRVIEEGDKQIQLISGSTEGLSSRVENLENNKFDKGGYDGTAQDLKILIDSKSTVSLSDNIPLQNEGSGRAGISETASRSDHSHPEQINIKGNSATSSKLQTARKINLSGDVSGEANFDGSSDIEISTILANISADKIVGGKLDISVIPKVAMPDFIVVQTDEERFKLTTDSVQNGDTVKVISTKKLYLVIDDRQLDSEEGYVVYTADVASSVDWSGVTGKPSTFPPSAHNQASNTITAMTGYTKPSSTSNITSSDNLNSAIGKLERGLDNKEPLIVKKTGFNLDKSDAVDSTSSTTIATSLAVKTAYDKAVQAYNNNPDLTPYQTKNDNTLSTTSKTIVGAINELKDGKLDSDGKAVQAVTADTAKACSGNSTTASKLYTARTINGVAFDGSKNITITASPSAHNQASNTITAMTGYTKPSSGGAIGTSDSLNVAIGKLEKNLDGKQPAGNYASSDHNHNGVYAPVSHGVHVEYATIAGKAPGSASVGVSNKVAREDHVHPLQTTVSGNAGTATKLQTARTINGTNFDGSTNITTANWGTARGITIGNTKKSVNGSADVSWSLSEIGALSSTTATTWNATGTTSGQGLTFYGKTVVGGTNDGWVRLNAHNQFSSGIYCGSTGVLRHDSEITVGSSGADGTTRIRSGVYDSTWGGNGVAHFSAHDTDSSGAHWLLASYYDASNIRSGIQVLTSSTGDMRLYTNRRSNYVTISGGNVLAGSSQNTSSNALTRKDYVDRQIATKLSTSGGTISGNLTVTGAIVSNGEVTAYSDRRLKTDIVKIENALEKVNQINGYTFTMLGTGKRQAGVIAQEIEKVLPEVVIQNENGYLTVMYSNIISLLIEAIKELSKEINELKGGKL